MMLLGGGQIVLSALLISAASLLLLPTIMDSVVIGLCLALSSTAIGVQTLSEKQQMASPHGRSALAILLSQDIAVIPMLAIFPLLAADAIEADGSSVFLSIAGGFAAITIIIIGGRYLMRPTIQLSRRYPNQRAIHSGRIASSDHRVF